MICLYLDGIFLIAHSRKEMIVAKDTLIFLIQNLGFLINVKKPVYQTCQKIEFLGVIVDSKEINTPLPQEKVLAIIEQCLTCLTCSRAQRDLVHNVPCVLHALKSHVPRALRAVMSHVPHALRVLVLHVPRAINDFAPHVPRVLQTLYSMCPRAL